MVIIHHHSGNEIHYHHCILQQLIFINSQLIKHINALPSHPNPSLSSLLSHRPGEAQRRKDSASHAKNQKPIYQFLVLRRERRARLVSAHLRCWCELGFKGQIIFKLLMNCRYCPSKSVGINYRPSPSLENIYTCQSHATSLFIPYSSQKPSSSKTKLERAFQRLVDCILAELNLLKGEALRLQQETLKLREEEAMEFRLNSELVSPYIAVAVDEELILSTFVKRLKDRTEKNRIYSQKKDPKRTPQTKTDKQKQTSSQQLHGSQMQGWECPSSFPLKLEKQLTQTSGKKKVNPSIYESSLCEKQSWLQKKVLARLSKKT